MERGVARNEIDSAIRVVEQGISGGGVMKWEK